MRICFFILNIFDFDSRARLICSDLLAMGWHVDIIATTGGKMTKFGEATIHAISQSSWPIRKRRFIEYNIRAARLGKMLKANIYHAVDLDTLWAATKAAKSNNGRVLYESRELYTELLSLSGRSIIKRLWREFEKRAIRHVDAIVTINEPIADELAKRYGILKPAVIMNVAASIDLPKPIDLRQKFNLQTKYVLIYQGILRPGQGIMRALEFLAKLPDIGLVFVGEGHFESDIKKCVTELHLNDRVGFSGMVSPDELPAYTAGADAGLLLMEPLALNNRLALPQKIFQYIAAGTPPIVSNLLCLRQIVEDDKLGLVLDDSDQASDAMIIDKFLDEGLGHARHNCLEAKKKYNWEIEGQKMIEVYKRLMK